MSDIAPKVIHAGKFIPDLRYVGVDPRVRTFGFVVLEGTTLLDSGVRRCDDPQFVGCLTPRFARVLATYQPVAVIVRKGPKPKHKSGPDRARPTALRAVMAAARQRHVPVIPVTPAAILEHFRQHGAVTKHEIAQVIVAVVPDLMWKLPPQRKPYESEDQRYLIFDSTAALLAHMRMPPPQAV